MSSVSFSEKQWCVKCQAMCDISPRSDPTFKCHRWVEVGGHTCDPWTAIGSHNNFLDPATLPALVWIHSCRFFEPDDVVDECTPLFDPKFFGDILNVTSLAEERGEDDELVASQGEPPPKHPLSRPTDLQEESTARTYHQFTVRFSPTDLGVPSSRRRVYTWFSLIGVIKQDLDSSGLPRVNTWMFEEMFYRKCVVDGSIYMVGDTFEGMESHRVAWATKRQEDAGG